MVAGEPVQSQGVEGERARAAEADWGFEGFSRKTLSFRFFCNDFYTVSTFVLRQIWSQASRAENDEKAHQLEENQKILNETLQSLARYFLLIFSKLSIVFLLRSDEDSRVKAEKLKEKALELAELRKKLEDADADIAAKDADIVEKVAEIENLKGLIKVLHFLKKFWLNLLFRREGPMSTTCSGKRKFEDRMTLSEAKAEDFTDTKDYVDFIQAKLKNVNIKLIK